MRVVNDASAKTIEDFLERLGCGKTTEEGKQMLNCHEAMILYLFLAVVGDREGRSFYADSQLWRSSGSVTDS